MITIKNKLAIAIALIVVLSSNIFAQGNFNTEWESPVGWDFEVFSRLEINSNVISLIFSEINNVNNVRIYNGSSHILEYSWTLPGAFQSLYLKSIYGLDYGYSPFSTNIFDINGDGVNEILQDRSFPNYSVDIVNPINGSILYSTKNIVHKIMDIDADGYIELVELVSGGTVKIISTPALTVSVNNQNEIVKDYELKQNYPNPFNPNTTIEYNLNSSSEVKVIIYDILGKEVSTLVNEKQNIGKYKLNLNGTGLSSGTYFYSLIVDGLAETKKMILVK